MPKYKVDYIQMTSRICYIEAESCAEAVEKFHEYEDVIDDVEEGRLGDKVTDVYLDE